MLRGESTLRVALSFGCSMQRSTQEVERRVRRCVEKVAAPEPEVSIIVASAHAPHNADVFVELLAELRDHLSCDNYEAAGAVQMSALLRIQECLQGKFHEYAETSRALHDAQAQHLRSLGDAVSKLLQVRGEFWKGGE